MPDPPFLAAELEHQIGRFHLKVSFRLIASWTVLFGPSGAGKSTILRMISGLIRPENGTIALKNEVLFDAKRGIFIPAEKRRIGYVTQKPALFPHRTVRQNLAFGIRHFGAKERENRIAEMLQLFRIQEFADRFPRELSGGQYQRVALARALAPEPEFLLLDEPFTGLDAQLTESVLNDLTGWLKARKIPALYVSHDIAEAYQTGAEVIVIENGRVETQGPVHEVLASRREQLLRRLGASQPRPAPAPDECRTAPRPFR